MAILFSVIIPLFNKEESILKTVNSVLNQTYSEFELILINDGSTDRSIEQLSLISDSRLKIINKTNEGVSSARNLGIEISIGQYCAFLDADDEWNIHYLNTMYHLIIDFPQASFFGCQIIYKFGNKENVINSMHNKRGPIGYFENSAIAPLVSSSSIIVKKSCFDEVGHFDIKLSRGEDLDLWWRLACSYILAFEPKPLVIYVQDSNNRACRTVLPLKKYFLPKNLSLMTTDKKNYALKLINGIVYEMAHNYKFRNLFLLLWKYNLHALKIYWILIRKTTKQLGK